MRRNLIGNYYSDRSLDLNSIPFELSFININSIVKIAKLLRNLEGIFGNKPLREGKRGVVNPI